MGPNPFDALLTVVFEIVTVQCLSLKPAKSDFASFLTGVSLFECLIDLGADNIDFVWVMLGLPIESGGIGSQEHCRGFVGEAENLFVSFGACLWLTSSQQARICRRISEGVRRPLLACCQREGRIERFVQGNKQGKGHCHC